MILDKFLVFSSDQTITVDAASSDVVDLIEGGDAIGQELTFECRVSNAFTGVGDNDTVQVKIQTSDDNSSFTDLVMSPAVKVKGLKAGSPIFKIRMPQGAKRYLRAYYDVTFAAGTATGKVSAWASKEL